MTTIETGRNRPATPKASSPTRSSGTRTSPTTIAREAGIAELTPRHWLVVNYMRETYLATGEAPSIRTLGKASGVQIKELYVLFPKGPAKLAAKIGGIPKPHGCI